MAGFISLPRNGTHKKEETKRLNILPSNFVEFFYRDWLGGIDFSQDSDFQQQLVKNKPSEDVKKYLLATSEFDEEIKGEIDLYITNSRLNEASFRERLDPISKNIIKNQNPIELLFKGVKHFDAQSPVIGSLIREVDIGRKKDLRKFLDKAPNIRDLELRSRLNKLRDGREFFNRGLTTIIITVIMVEMFFLPPPPSPPRFDFPDETGQRPLPNIESSLNDNVNYFPPPPPPLPPLPPFQLFLQPPLLQRAPGVTVRRKNDAATNTTQTMSGDCLTVELEQVIEKEKPKENLVYEDNIIFALPKNT